MAEYAASILGIASFAVQLSHSLYQVGGRIAGARVSINRVSTNLALFASTLKHVAAVLASSKSLHTPEAEHTVHQIVTQCNRLFSEIQDLATPGTDLLQRSSSDPRQRMRVFERIRWSFEQPKVERLLAHLEYLKSTLCILIQTLTLAIHMSRASHEPAAQQQQASADIDLERTHIETLIYARHLSIMIVREHAAADPADQPSRSSSPAGSESTIEVSRPQYIDAQPMSPASTDVVRLGGTLDFLEQAAPHDAQIRRQSISLSSDVVDLLLKHWTTLHLLPDSPPSASSPPKERHVWAADAKIDPFASQSSTPTKQEPLPTVEEVESPPPFSLDPSEPLGKSIAPLGSSGPGDRAPPSPSSSPTNSTTSSWSHVSSETPKATSGILQVPRPANRDSTEYPPTPPAQSPSAANSCPPALARSASTPEPDTRKQAPLQPLSRHTVPPPPKAGSQNARPILPGGTVSAAEVDNARKNISSPMSTDSNYRAPFISSARSDTMSATGSDHESFVDYPLRQPSTHRAVDATAAPIPLLRVESGSLVNEDHGDGEDVGLGIPWRIRISSKRGFDFVDKKPVGSTRNVDHVESIFQHSDAKTEISQAWVHLRALQEKNLPFEEISAAEFSEDRRSKGWRIARALQFRDVEALVDRSAEIVHQIATEAKRPTPRQQQQQQQPPASQPAPSIGRQAPTQSASQPLPYPADDGQHIVQPVPIPQAQTIPRRTVSFTGGPRPDLRPPPSSPPSSRRNREPRPASSYSPLTPNLARSWSNNDQIDREPPKNRYNPREMRDMRYFEERYAAQRNSERDSSRSSRKSARSSWSYADRGRDRDRDGRHRSAGTKLARLGGLAALLDGMDSLIL